MSLPNPTRVLSEKPRIILDERNPHMPVLTFQTTQSNFCLRSLERCSEEIRKKSGDRILPLHTNMVGGEVYLMIHPPKEHPTTPEECFTDEEAFQILTRAICDEAVAS